MSENPLSLTIQLANRLKTFATNLGLSQRQISKILKLDESHLSRFLDGKAGLSAEMTLKVLRLTSVTKKELALKFGKPEKLSAKITGLQQAGHPMRLDVGWVPQVGKDNDPDNNSPSIIDDPDDDSTEYFLKNQIAIHQAAIAAISDYLNKAPKVPKARVNPGPTTEGSRRVDTKPKAGGGSRLPEYQ